MIIIVKNTANRTLLLQERTGHLRAQPVETHVYPNCFSSSLFFCFDSHFESSSGLPLYTSSQTPVPGSPFPVPCSLFPVLVTSVGKLANCFLLVEVGAPNDCRAAFVGCSDDEVISVFEIYEGSPFFFGEVGEFGVAIRF